jgi:hypothetical protein
MDSWIEPRRNANEEMAGKWVVYLYDDLDSTGKLAR